MNESQFTVSLGDAGPSVTDPRGKHSHLSWESVREVVVITTDGGPFEPDFWIGFIGDGTQCGFPMGATGVSSEDIFAAFKRLPGFDYEAYIAATSSVSSAQFVVWRRVPR